MKKMVIFAALLSGCMQNQQLSENAVTIQTLKNQIVDLKNENKALKEKIEEGRIPSGVVAVRTARGVDAEVAAGTVVDSNAARGYEDALNLYRAGDVEAAVKAFCAYLDGGARDEKAVMAQYWLGDAYYSQRNFKEAVRYLGTFLKNKPQSEKTAPALKKLIYALRAVGRESEANILEKEGAKAIQ